MTKKIALITGGFSGEAEISYLSAATMLANLDRTKWDPYLIDITEKGWVYTSAEKDKYEIDKNDFSILHKDGKISFEAVLIGIHGSPGEDGKLQGYFDCIGMRYSTCDAASSAVTFNKRFTVSVAAFSGIYVSKSVAVFQDDEESIDNILVALKLPIFVKPNSGGSSLGMSKVNCNNELPAALKKAFAIDPQVLVEEFIEGRECTIGIFSHQGKTIALPITEIIPDNEFFDFQAKYEGASKEITPANFSEIQVAKIRKAALKAYKVFNCKGLVRVDFIYDVKKDEPIFLEVNTVPGQSSTSLVPQQVVAMGWTLQEFYTAILDECFQ